MKSTEKKVMNIEIDADDYQLLFELLGQMRIPSSGEKIEIPGGATLTFSRVEERRGIETPLTVEFVLWFAGGVASKVVASWLWEKIAGRSKRIRIERTEITEVTEEKFKKIFHETIEIGD